MADLTVDELPLAPTRPTAYQLPDGRFNMNLVFPWLIGTKDGGSKVVANPFEAGTPSWFEYTIKEHAGVIMIGGAALILLLALSGGRRR